MYVKCRLKNDNLKDFIPQKIKFNQTEVKIKK